MIEPIFTASFSDFFEPQDKPRPNEYLFNYLNAAWNTITNECYGQIVISFPPLNINIPKGCYDTTNKYLAANNIHPTMDPTLDPTTDPTIDPTMEPTTGIPTQPTELPTIHPTMQPTLALHQRILSNPVVQTWLWILAFFAVIAIIFLIFYLYHRHNHGYSAVLMTDTETEVTDTEVTDNAYIDENYSEARPLI